MSHPVQRIVVHCVVLVFSALLLVSNFLKLMLKSVFVFSNVMAFSVLACTIIFEDRIEEGMGAL